MRRAGKPQARGFTLIELLVVIAIIAILAAILFPVFAQAREAARKASCQSNLKQVASAFQMYIQDYDGQFPWAAWRYPNTGVQDGPDQPFGRWKDRNTGWTNVIYPYIKNTKVFRCPSASDPPTWATDPSGDDSQTTGASTYAYNMNIGDRFGWEGTTTKDAQLSYPASTILVFEGSSWGENQSMVRERSEWGWQGTFEQNLQTNGQNRAQDNDGGPNQLLRHSGGANYAFCDGHVKFYPQSQMRVACDQTLINGIMKCRTGATPTLGRSETDPYRN